MTVATSQPLPTTVQADPPPDPVELTAPRSGLVGVTEKAGAASGSCQISAKLSR